VSPPSHPPSASGSAPGAAPDPGPDRGGGPGSGAGTAARAAVGRRGRGRAASFIDDIDVVLWDLDGTLTDPKVGITSGVQYALARLGVEVADADDLVGYIGPPIRDAFIEFHAVPEDQVEHAVATYREYYLDRGIFENVVIPGIPEALAAIGGTGRSMAVATSKVDWMAERILEHFELRDHFSVVGGATLDGSRGTKVDVIEHTLAELGIGAAGTDRDRVVIIGDREHDVLGARSAGIRSIGVRWGFAGAGELEAAGADVIVGSVAELRALFVSSAG
jgi:phosphoglycolate phosphatase